MRREIAFSIVSILLLCAGRLPADDVLLGQIYGAGVHAFNQGDYVSAYNALTSAIKGGSHDPRAFYFRGLTYLRLGRDDEAKADFEKGAALEVGDSANEFPVNRSLERIQGPSRQMLEYYRMTVHAVAVQRQESARQARYEERAAAEDKVLRRVKPAELSPSPAAESRPVPATESDTTTPSNPVDSAPQTPSTKPAPDVNKNDNPFDSAPKSAVPTPAPADAGADPFGSSPATPATEKAAPPPATSPDVTPSATQGGATGASVKPTQGGIGSLFHAVTVGLKTDEPPPGADASMPGGMMDLMRGLTGGAPSGAPPAASAVPNDAGGPPAAGAGPQPAMPAGNAAAPPAGDDLFGQPATPAAAAPATTPQPAPADAAAGQSATPAPATPSPATPAPATPPKSDDPFN